MTSRPITGLAGAAQLGELGVGGHGAQPPQLRRTAEVASRKRGRRPNAMIRSNGRLCLQAPS